LPKKLEGGWERKKGIEWKGKWSRRGYDACAGEEDKRSQSLWTAWQLQTKAVRFFQASVSTSHAT